MQGNPRSTAQIAGHPIHPMLVAFPASFLVAVPICDFAFWKTQNPTWSVAALWLLGAALAAGTLAAVAGFVDFAGDSRIRALREARRHMVGNVFVLLLSVLNWCSRYFLGDAAVLPWGFCVSLTVFLILFYTGWNGWQMVYKHRVGVADQ